MAGGSQPKTGFHPPPIPDLTCQDLNHKQYGLKRLTLLEVRGGANPPP